MIRISQLKLPVDHTDQDLEKQIQKNLKGREVLSWKIKKQSLDARRGQLTYQYVIDVKVKEKDEKRLLSMKNKKLSPVKEQAYVFPWKAKKVPTIPPVIIGTGPAGLFCGLFLARAGFHPILIERGQEASRRRDTVEHFWKTGQLNEDSNVQFGEGGAGTFSDGKLNTLVKDKFLRNQKVLEELALHGAPEEILWKAKPHIGTDYLIQVVENIRKEIIDLGGQVFFETKMTDLQMEHGQIQAIHVETETKKKTIPVNHLVLAVGHSARDTFSMLYERGIHMEQKAFAVGIRIEHPREMINDSQYGPDWKKYHLPTASYKLTFESSGKRGVYSFCMCPGGYVVNASSEKGCLAVNGMSNHDRMAQNSNSALIVTVTPDDYKEDHPLAGVEFQRKLERAAFGLCNGKIPVQLYEDFKENRLSDHFGGITPSMKGEYGFANLKECLPPFLTDALEEAIEAFGEKIDGYDRPDSLLSGVESRTSSPVKIPRDENFFCNIKGIYPCGEGAGYAGGITSAAMDGIKVAEAVAKSMMET